MQSKLKKNMKRESIVKGGDKSYKPVLNGHVKVSEKKKAKKNGVKKNTA
jgi:hypothetical protein